MLSECIVPLYYRIYFRINPFFPRSMWLFLRRLRAQYIRKKNQAIWPVNPSEGKWPEYFHGWPHEKKFCLVLTHDVEREKGLSGVTTLLQLEKELGFRSAFHFVGQDYTTPESLRHQIMAEGFEVGLHGLQHNHRMFSSERTFKKFVMPINRILAEWKVKGFRSPSMFHQLDWMHSLNIRYDSSTFDYDPFEPQPDGMHTIFPFTVTDQHTGNSYIELPNTLPQDHTLFIVLREKTIDIWKKKLDWIAEKQGMALVNIHPDYILYPGQENQRTGYSVDIYRQFLQYIIEAYSGCYWNALPGEVADFWRHEHSSNKTKSLEIRTTGKHICMPTYSYYESDNRVRRYAETLVREGCDVEVYCLRKRGQNRSEVIRGVQIYRIQRRTKNESKSYSYLGKLLLFLINSSVHMGIGHLRWKYDLVHVHNIPDFEVFAALFPKLFGSKVILDIHDIVPELFISKFGGNGWKSRILFKVLCWIEKVSTSFADHVIIANDLWHHTLCKRSVNPSKCTVFLNYPDSNLFSSRQSEINAKNDIFIFPGSLNYHQGLDIAIEAFSLIAGSLKKIEFHIFGDGPAKESLINLVIKKRLQDRILFKTPLPIDHISTIMAQARCGIVPKRADSFGNTAFSTKILEFMALGVPVIVSDTEIDRYYFDASIVLFFKSGDAEDLARKMLLLMQNDELRENLIRNAQIFVQDFQWITKKDSYIQLVGELIGPKR